MASRCDGTAVARSVDTKLVGVPGTSSIFQESRSNVGGSIIKSTETSSDDATVDTVDGVPNADTGSLCLLLLAAA